MDADTITWVPTFFTRSESSCRINHYFHHSLNHSQKAIYLHTSVPNFIRKYKDLHGKCRRDVEGCEDCRKTEMSLIKNIHFTNCRKPWNCAGSKSGKGGIDERTADYDHCMKIAKTWHEMRKDLEHQIATITGNHKVISEGQKGEYNKDFFLGHCDGDGQSGYLPIAASKENMAATMTQIWKDSQ